MSVTTFHPMYSVSLEVGADFGAPLLKLDSPHASYNHILFISVSPGQAVPDPAFLGRTHQFLISLLGSTRLHEASGEDFAPLYTTEERPRVAREAKGSQFGGGHHVRCA